MVSLCSKHNSRGILTCCQDLYCHCLYTSLCAQVARRRSPYGARLQLPDCLSGVQKTLGLVMIVKDEAATIQTTLASMRDHIDEWTIVDTGSTDGTQVGPAWPAP